MHGHDDASKQSGSRSRLWLRVVWWLVLCPCVHGMQHPVTQREALATTAEGKPLYPLTIHRAVRFVDVHPRYRIDGITTACQAGSGRWLCYVGGTNTHTPPSHTRRGRTAAFFCGVGCSLQRTPVRTGIACPFRGRSRTGLESPKVPKQRSMKRARESGRE